MSPANWSRISHFPSLKNSSGAKALELFCCFCGTTKVVPFQYTMAVKKLDGGRTS
jgi:hypothetical protein